MAVRLLQVMLVCLVMLVTACAGRAASQNLAGLDVTLQEQPRQGMKQELHIKVVDKNKQPVNGATVQIEGNMNHPGMVPVPATAAPRGDGVYVATMEYTMTGQWSLTVTASTPNGDSVQKIFAKNVQAGS